jgi:hypothetical protein
MAYMSAASPWLHEAMAYVIARPLRLRTPGTCMRTPAPRLPEHIFCLRTAETWQVS